MWNLQQQVWLKLSQSGYFIELNLMKASHPTHSTSWLRCYEPSDFNETKGKQTSLLPQTKYTSTSIDCNLFLLKLKSSTRLLQRHRSHWKQTHDQCLQWSSRSSPGDLSISWLGIILCIYPANERRRYIVTSSPIDCVHTQNDLCLAGLYAVITSMIPKHQ